MTRTRSPNFPSIDLERAVELAEKLYSHAQRHAMPVTAMVKDLWDMSPTGSTAKQAVGALRAYGLIEVEGSGDKRKARVSEDAAKILEGHSDRQKLLRSAALLPKVHKSVWDHCGGESGLGPDQAVQHYLLFDHDPPFNKAVTASFIKRFRDTLSFAGIGSDDIVEPDGEAASDEKSPGEVRPRGALQPKPTPRREVRPGMNQDVFTLAEGEVVLQWPSKLTPESFEDFKDWLRLIERKVKRAVAEPEAEPPDEGSE